MDIIDLLNIIMVVAIFLIMVLGVILILILTKNNQKKQEKKEFIGTDSKKIEKPKKQTDDVRKESTFDFLEFDEVKDNMIIRKNREQYVMVVECKGINYDLLSEEEKLSVEQGFTQFLNTLRFPVQLYIQTSSLNLKSIISQYHERLQAMQNKINNINMEINKAKMQGDDKKLKELMFNKRREENVIEYTADISEYIERLSQNKNVLQQKPYVVVAYYKSELGRVENFSNDEIDNMAFSELYTRTQSMIRSLSSAGVLGKVLSSEELVELLYIAYNREASEYIQYSQAVEAQYDSLYSTGKDILTKKEEQLNQQIERESLELATNSITIADQKLKEKIEKKDATVKKKALEIVEEYKDQMRDDLYEQTKKEIMGTEEEIIQESTTKRGRPKKSKE